MNLTNESYVFSLQAETFTDRYYKDQDGWVKQSSRGRTLRLTAEQILNHILPARARVKPGLSIKVGHHD